MADYFTFNYKQIITNWLTKGGQADDVIGWGPSTQSWTGGEITYFVPTTQPAAWWWLPDRDKWDGFVSPGANQFNLAVEAFELWDDLIAVDLNFSADFGANIVLSNSTSVGGFGVTNAVAFDTDGDPSNLEMQDANIWFNAGRPQYADAAISYGSEGFTAYIHEIGHALGLSHPGNYDAGDQFVPIYEFDAGYKEATQQYTVMSYFQAGSDGARVDHWGTSDDPLAEDPWIYGSTPLLHDILAIQSLYGADMTTRTGNTRYGFNSNAGRDVYDFTKNTNPVIAIWDAGGIDTIDVSGFRTSQLIDLNQGAFSNVGSMDRNLAIAYGCDIENAIGGSGANTLIGNALNNSLIGGEYNDILDGRAGSDVMMGGDGDDTYYVDRGRTVTTFGDTFFIDDGDRIIELDTATSGRRDKVISTINYTLATALEELELAGTANINGTGNGKNNILIGNSGVNRLSGGDGMDTIDGRGGNDVMVGGTGGDMYTVDSTGDQIIEVDNVDRDTVTATATFTLPDFVEDLVLSGTANIDGTGNDLANLLYGNTGNNRLDGKGGNDRLDGSLGADTLIGGKGDDTYVIGSWGEMSRADSLGDQIIELANEGTDTVESRWDYILGDNLENLFLGSGGYFGRGNALNNELHGLSGANMPNKLEGMGGNDKLYGYAGQDILDGGEGDDLLEGGIDADRLIGGAGSDTASYAGSSKAVMVVLADQVAKGGDAADDILESIENLIGSRFADRLEGSTGNNVIEGGAGADTLAGRGGVDTLSYSSSSAAVQVNLELRTATGGDAQGDIFSGFMNLTGSKYADTLTGDAQANVIDGAAGADRMAGGLGNDVYFVDNADDIVNEASDGGTDTVRSTVSYTITDNVEKLKLIGDAAIKGIGNALNNVLVGNSAANKLNGAGGADTMSGGLGDDIYVVDNINDVIIEKANEGTDRINASVSYALSADVEKLLLIGSAAINGTGNTLANDIQGNTANNVLDGGAGADSLTGGAGFDTFVFRRGQAHGDVVSDFAGNGAAAGDMLNLVGYGAGAALHQVDATHWQIDYNNGASHETLTFTNGASIHASDFLFL